jgi:hypothetical protein
VGIKNRSLQIGDDITITRTTTETKTVKVLGIGMWSIQTDELGYISNAAEDVPSYDDQPIWTVSKVVHAKPKDFPIQSGDVWLADDGNEWFVFSMAGSISELRAITTPHDANARTNLSKADFEPKALKLLHRAGE